VDEGKLDMDKSLWEYLPDYPRNGLKNDSKGKVVGRDNDVVDMSAWHLATHQSGIRHYNDESEMYITLNLTQFGTLCRSFEKMIYSSSLELRSNTQPMVIRS